MYPIKCQPWKDSYNSPFYFNIQTADTTGEKPHKYLFLQLWSPTTDPKCLALLTNAFLVFSLSFHSTQYSKPLSVFWSPLFNPHFYLLILKKYEASGSDSLDYNTPFLLQIFLHAYPFYMFFFSRCPWSCTQLAALLLPHYFSYSITLFFSPLTVSAPLAYKYAQASLSLPITFMSSLLPSSLLIQTLLKYSLYQWSPLSHFSCTPLSTQLILVSHTPLKLLLLRWSMPYTS